MTAVKHLYLVVFDSFSSGLSTVVLRGDHGTNEEVDLARLKEYWQHPHLVESASDDLFKVDQLRMPIPEPSV